MPDGSTRAGAFFARLFTGVAGRVLVALVAVAVVAGVLTVPENRAWVLSAAGIEQGRKTDTGPRVKVGRGSPGRPPVLGHLPEWTARPVKVPGPGSAEVTPGGAFAAAGSLPIAVADASVGEAVIAPARSAARVREAAERAWTPQVAAAAQRAATVSPLHDLTASSPGELWVKAARQAPGSDTTRPTRVGRGQDKGIERVVPRSGPVPVDPVGAAMAAAAQAPATVAQAPAQAGPAGGSAAAAGAGPVAVTVLGQDEVSRLGGRYLGFRVSRPGGGNAPVAVSLDYSGIADAAGGDFGGRLRLVAYPGCVLTTPEVPACRVGTPVVAVNDPATQKITAVVTPDGPVAAAATTPEVSPSLSPSVSPSPSTSAAASPSPSAGSPVVSPVGDPSASATSSATVSPSTAASDGSVDLTGRTQPAAYHPAAVAVPRAGSAVVGAVYALASSPSSSAGSYTATGLQASMSWDVGLQTGTFTYEVPFPFAPAPAGDTPELGLRYSSSDVDGMTSTENPQGSESGAGWSTNVPFIERRYKPCADGSGNLCWAGLNASLVLDGQSGQLVDFGAATGAANTRLWRMTDDQGWKVEQIQPGNSVNNNGDANGEYWRVTSTDGTQYYFGYENPAWGPVTNSTMRLPLYGQASGDTCWPQTSHMCFKAWRWNLAYVVDPDGNLQRYTWDKDRLSYATLGGAITSAQHYDAVGHLSTVEYGFTTANAASTPAPARTAFTYKWRCNADDACQGPTVDPASWYPDVPFDLWCKETATACPNGPSTPVFFGLKKFDLITSQYWTGTGYQDVEQLNLDHSYPVQSGSLPTQFLVAIKKSGLSGAVVKVPDITLQEVMLANRAKPGSGQSAIVKPRIGVIQNEFGGLVKVSYGQPDPCTTLPSISSADTQATDCFPRYENGGWGWFNKYLVSKVEVSDAYGAPAQTTQYTYDSVSAGGKGAGWHSDDDPLTPAGQQSWSDFRGYRKLFVQKGTGTNQTTEEYRYFRGLNGDATRTSGSVKSVSLSTYPSSPDAATSGLSYPDQPWLNGQVLEHRVLRYSADPNLPLSDRDELSSEQTTYDSYIVSNGTPGPNNIYHHKVVQVGEASTLSMTAKGGTARALKHTVRHAYDHIWDRELWEQDDGDPSTGIGASCDYTVYGGWNGTEFVPDMTSWVIDAPRQELSTSTACPTTPTQVPTTNLIDRKDLYYGGNWADLTSSPNTTDVTRTVEYADATTPARYTATKYDARGRVIAEIDPDNYLPAATSFETAGLATTTQYTETNGLVTGKVETDEAGHVTTTTLDPGRQLVTSITDLNGRTTRSRYDALGRLLAVQLPGDDFEAKTFTYTVSNTAPSVVRTDAYPAAGASPVSSWQFLDSLGRIYQTQKASPTGGQMVAGTRFDDKGDDRVEVKAFATTGGTLGTVVPNWYDSAFTVTIPSQTVTTTDDVDRPVRQDVRGLGNVVVTTETTSYDGYATTTTPPSNAGAGMPDIAPITITDDAYGRQVSRTQNGLTATSTYDIAGNLVTVTSPTGKTISYGYDWLGNQTTVSDPDVGSSTTDYYPSGAVRHARDANGRDLFTAIDVLGREVATYAGTSTAGTKLSETVYDGVPLGATTPLLGTVTSQTSWDDGKAYTQRFGYDTRYRTVRNDQEFPSQPGAGLGLLAGTYSTTRTYDALDRQTSVTYPGVGGLPAEAVTTGWVGEYATTLTSPLATYVAETTYTNTGQIASRILGTNGATGSVKRTYTWDAATGRLTNQSAAVPSTNATANAQNDTYTYAPTGDITKITDGVAGQQQCFTYDVLDRLVAALTSTSAGDAGTKTGSACTADTFGPDPYNQTYTYDNDANMTSLTSAGVASTYGYGTDTGRGVTGGPHAPTSVARSGATTTYSYDAAGQLIKRVAGGVTTTYTWDLGGKLASMTTGAGPTAETATFVEGPDDTRWARISKSETVAYLDGQEIHLPAGATSTSQATGTRYYDLDDHTIATRTTTSGLDWILADRQDSATVAVDVSTGIMTRDRYLPYGGNRNPTGTWTMPTDRGWQGQIQDKDTGLDYLGARYYDPQLAHFISADELTDNDQTAAANPYGYAAANPILFNDPTGLWPSFFNKVANFAANHPVLTEIAVGVAVGVAIAATGGVGVVAAAAIAGAAGSSVSYGARVAAGRESFSAKNLAKSAVGGALTGAALGAAGRLAAPIAGNAAAAVTQRVVKPAIKAAATAGGKAVAGTARATRTVAAKLSNAGKTAVTKAKASVSLHAGRALRDHAEKVRDLPGVKFVAHYVSSSGRSYFGHNRHGMEAEGPVKALISRYHRHAGCAEMHCLMQAYKAEGVEGIRGGKFRVIMSRNRTSPNAAAEHGRRAYPCKGCSSVLQRIKAKVVAKGKPKKKK